LKHPLLPYPKTTKHEDVIETVTVEQTNENLFF